MVSAKIYLCFEQPTLYKDPSGLQPPINPPPISFPEIEIEIELEFYQLPPGIDNFRRPDFSETELTPNINLPPPSSWSWEYPWPFRPEQPADTILDVSLRLGYFFLVDPIVAPNKIDEFERWRLFLESEGTNSNVSILEGVNQPLGSDVGANVPLILQNFIIWYSNNVK